MLMSLETGLLPKPSGNGLLASLLLLWKMALMHSKYYKKVAIEIHEGLDRHFEVRQAVKAIPDVEPLEDPLFFGNPD